VRILRVLKRTKLNLLFKRKCKRSAHISAAEMEATRSVNLVCYLAHDYDEAIAFFVGKMGFELVEDQDRGEGKRWVVVRAGSAGVELVIVKACTSASKAAVGKQTGDEVGFFLQTDDFMRDYEKWAAAGVKFREAPRHEVYGIVSVFEDLYGNGWDLIQRPEA